MICQHCQTANPDGAKFCMNCGGAMIINCPHCGTQLPGEAKFCHNCGQKISAAAPAPPQAPIEPPSSPVGNLQQLIPGNLLAKLDAARASRAMEGERRIVTMLFCDVKGSTSMAETLDPEEWAGIMNQVFARMIAAVYQYEGTVARLMGDAILAFFGAPIAHEDDPQRAVLTGLAIIDAIRPFRDELKQKRGLDFDVRVGINTGLVVVGEVGSDLRVEYTAMGDAVNLAARMEQTAQPGTVQVSNHTHKLVQHFFDFEFLGGIEVKGKKEPIPTYRAIAPKARPGSARGIEGLYSPLVGRERELKGLQARLDDLVGGKGRILSVMGEAGLGKSRLMAELRRTIPDGIQWYEGRSLSYLSSTPYTPFISLFRAMLELDGEEAHSYDEVKVRISRLAGEKGAQQSPFIATMLGINPSGDDLDRVKYLEPPQMRDSVFQAIQCVIELLAGQNPLVLVFEDLHWADPTSLDLLDRLMPLTNQIRLALIGLFRPHREEPCWRFHETAAHDYPARYTSVILDPLDDNQARTLVGNLLQIEDLPEKVRALILKKSEGNPFFVEEVIRSLLDAKLVVRDGEHWRAVREVETITVPDTLAGVITARLDRLDEDSRRAAQTASVIGREFAYLTMESIYEARPKLDPALATLEQRELIREKGRVPAPLYFFKHALTQETAYSSLLMSKRRDLHRRVAECIEQTEPDRANEIAWHFLEAGENVRALPYLVEAGERAGRAYATAEATGYYRRALEILDLVDNLPLARRAYEGLGNTLRFANDLPGAIDVYKKMLALAEARGDTSMQISALNKLSLALLWLADFNQIDANLEVSERLAKDANDLPGMAEMYMARCQRCLIVADFPNAVKYLSASAEVGKALTIDELRMFGLSHLANTMTYMLRFDEAWKTAQECQELALKVGNRLHLSELLSFPIPFHYLISGDLDSAQRAAEEALYHADAIGFAISQFIALFTLGSIMQSRGEHDGALRTFERALEVAKKIGIPMFPVMALGALGGAYLDISDTFVDQVTEIHFRANQLLATPAGMGGGASAWAELGLCCLARGDLEHAEEFFNKGLTIPTPHMLLYKPRQLLGLAFVALERDDLETAEKFVGEARTYVDQNGMKHLDPAVALVEGIILAGQGRLDQALTVLSKAESLAVAMNLRPIIWQAQVQSAGNLARLGRNTEAASKLNAAEAMVREIAGLFSDEQLRTLYVKNAAQKLTLAH